MAESLAATVPGVTGVEILGASSPAPEERRPR
jgi:hypothetical protein